MTTTTLDNRPAGEQLADRAAVLDEDPLVLEVAPTATSPEAIFLGLALGAGAGLLLAASLSLALGEPLLAGWPVVGFFGGWLASAWFVARDAWRLAVVIRRGALLGTFQWLGLSLVGSWDVATGAPLAGLAGGPATFMMWFSAGLFVVCWAATRQERRAVV